ncbi:hypothetical protein ALTERO38_51030 [Alteromonas sp. 38]|nr:hypothetical protein ALTER154_70212 [Alteromonas sp. 154]VXB57968.1 hypothetical protein ALTERO38_51030 [Alteromonas sp. 38]
MHDYAQLRINERYARRKVCLSDIVIPGLHMARGATVDGLIKQ